MATAVRIDGKAVASRVEADCTIRTAVAKARGLTPGLAVVQVGADPASNAYVGQKEKAAGRIGFHYVHSILPESASQADLSKVLLELNTDPKIHGIIVQQPLPKQLSAKKANEEIALRKDVDCLNAANLGRLIAGESDLAPCTPAGVLELLRAYDVPIAGKRAVVVGRSTLVGRPLAHLLIQADATVTVAHSKTPDLAAVCREADILCVAIGRARMIGPTHVKPGAVVIDVGITRGADGKLAGDVDFDAVSAVASMVTPVPGGVGPMTVAMLMRNVLAAAGA